MQPAPRPSTFRRIVRVVLPLVFVALAFLIVYNRQALQDRLVLWQYQPPAEIVELADRSSLSNYGRDLFYVTQPELHDKSSFTSVCKNLGDEESNVLGCFNGQRIYIFNVTDPELEGVREVTAAHEMLHLAYQRLDVKQKERVNNLIEQQLRTSVEPHVKDLIAVYERLEPGQVLNEMHSILATEQRSLLPELEDYFTQYFKDRNTVVGLAETYRSVFDSLKKQQQALADELDALAEQINSETAQLNAQIENYNTDVAVFNQRAQSGAMTREEFDNERAALNEDRAALEAANNDNRQKRTTYDAKRQQFESLSVEATRLQKSIDSRPVDAAESVE